MPTKYHVRPNSVDSHQADPYWMALIVRYAEPITFDRKKILGEEAVREISTSATVSPVQERAPLLLVNAITSWSVTVSKSGHVSTAGFELAPSNLNYSQEIQPGDWILFWVVESEADFINLKNRLKQVIDNKAPLGTSVNGFYDGLKFIGKTSSPRQTAVVTNSGAVQIRYSLTASQFSEFDAAVYLTAAHVALGASERLGNTSTAISVGLANQKKLSFQPTDLIINEMNFSLGEGPLVRSGKTSEDDPLLTPNDQFLIPQTVAKILLGNSGGGRRYIDLLQDSFFGVQGGGPNKDFTRATSTPEAIAEAFAMESIGDAAGFYAGYSFTGQDVPIWDRMAFYENAPINEMYITLRITPGNRIMPTFVYRQSPFSSDAAFSGIGTQDGVSNITPFKSLPRWVLDPTIVTTMTVGASDTLKYNYVHFQGKDQIGTERLQQSLSAFVFTPPVKDGKSILRDGLRVRIIQGTSSVTDKGTSQAGPKNYTKFMADMIMGAHLTWTGSISCRGIVEPIPVGDNVEFNGIIYHIDQISHRGSISPNGTKTFETSMSVSHGMANERTSNGLADVYPHEITWTDFPDLLQARTALDVRSDIGGGGASDTLVEV